MTRITIRSAMIVGSLALLLSACDNDPTAVDGKPEPVTTGQSSAPGTSVPASGVADLVGCELVTDAEVESLKPGYKQTEPHTDDGDKYNCEWLMGSGPADVIAIGLIIRPDMGVDQASVPPGFTAQDGKVNDTRDAKMLKQERTTTESCHVLMAVGPSSHVAVDGNGDKGVACGMVEKLASVVHMKLEERGL